MSPEVRPLDVIRPPPIHDRQIQTGVAAPATEEKPPRQTANRQDSAACYRLSEGAAVRASSLYLRPWIKWGSRPNVRAVPPTKRSKTIASPATQTRQEHSRSLERAQAAARIADLNRARDITIIDLRHLTSVFDYFVLATGSSRRQLHAIAEEIDEVLRKQYGDKRLGLEGYTDSRWILLDFGDVVIHLFDDETRQYYDLENLWAGAKRVPFEPSAPPAGSSVKPHDEAADE